MEVKKLGTKLPRSDTKTADRVLTSQPRLKKPRYFCSAECFHGARYAYIFCKTAMLKLEGSIRLKTWRIARFIEH